MFDKGIDSAVEWAAKNGNLMMLKWLKKSGCPWDKKTFREAAFNGDLEIMKWLKLKKCPWDEFIFYTAKFSGHNEASEWLLSNGAPVWDY